MIVKCVPLIDLGPAGLKVVAIDDALQCTHDVHVSFDDDLSEFKTSGGVLRKDSDSTRVQSPVAMFVAALDLAMQRLLDASFPFARVRAISGAGQQHGSVYWSQHAESLLRDVQPGKSLCQQLTSQSNSESRRNRACQSKTRRNKACQTTEKNRSRSQGNNPSRSAETAEAKDAQLGVSGIMRRVRRLHERSDRTAVNDLESRLDALSLTAASAPETGEE